MDEKEEKKCLVAEGYKSEQEVRGSSGLVSTWWTRFYKKDKKERKKELSPEKLKKKEEREGRIEGRKKTLCKVDTQHALKSVSGD